jgi:hypothetical protein
VFGVRSRLTRSFANAQDFASGLRRPLNGSTWGARGRPVQICPSRPTIFEHSFHELAGILSFTFEPSPRSMSDNACSQQLLPVSLSSALESVRDAMRIGKHLTLAGNRGCCVSIRHSPAVATAGVVAPALREGHWRSLCLVPGSRCPLSTFVRSCYGQRSHV